MAASCCGMIEHGSAVPLAAGVVGVGVARAGLGGRVAGCVVFGALVSSTGSGRLHFTNRYLTAALPETDVLRATAWRANPFASVVEVTFVAFVTRTRSAVNSRRTYFGASGGTRFASCWNVESSDAAERRIEFGVWVKSKASCDP